MTDVDMEPAGLDPAELGTAPQAPERPPRLTPLGYLRYSWRQLTSMRTALVLLFMLALAAVPGSILPQRSSNPLKVRDYYVAHPDLAPFLDRQLISGFNVYSSWWFSAIYLLLLISLAGCVLPRSWKHATAMRARPPAAPRRLERLPQAHAFETTLSADEVAARARKTLRRTRFRVDLAAEADGVQTVRAEKGFLRETGNLLFHVSLLVLLAGVAVGSLYGYKGTVLLVEGDRFVNIRGNYDDFSPGYRLDASKLPPFTVTVDDFKAQYYEDGDKAGTAKRFDAYLSWSTRPDGPLRRYDLRVNHPLSIGQTKVYLLGNGYAPHFVIRDDSGVVAFDGTVPFLPQDSNLSSEGVVKVPGAQPTQLGLKGLFTPSTQLLDGDIAISTFPAPRDPAVSLVAYRGDLGSTPSVYLLDTARMVKADRFLLRPGQTHQIAGGKATVTFTGYDMWTNLQVTYDPGKNLALVAAVVMVLGLLLSLRVRRRRVWVRARPAGEGRTVVEVGGLARTDETGFADEFARLVTRIHDTVNPPPSAGRAETKES